MKIDQESPHNYNFHQTLKSTPSSNLKPRINQVIEEIRSFQLRNIVHHVGVNRDGAIPTFTGMMTNEGFKFLSKSSQLFAELPQAPQISAVPIINDFQKLHVYKNGIVAATLRREDERRTREILVILNSKTANVETRPQFFLANDAGNIPTLEHFVLSEDIDGS
jgi:hypothetical protein